MTNDEMKFSELDKLSEEEKKYALEILKELSTNGNSSKLNDILYEDYEEMPVDIETFLHNDKYLGRALINSEGKFTIFPYWEKTLMDIFPNNLDTNYNTAVFTGAIGLGKSTIAVIAVLYQLYRMMCLKNPYIHYGLQDIDLITFAFMNITLDAAKGVAWSKCQQMLQRSDWFMQRGTLSKSDEPQWCPPKGIELICGSLPRHIIGRAVFGVFVDEVSFQPNQDIEKQKKKASDIVNTASARMQSRFMKGEKNPTILLMASSKRTEQSFLETFIENKKKNESKTTLIIDEPQWRIRTDKDSPNKFKVAIGNKFLNSEVLPLNITEQELKLYRDKGYIIWDVPMGYYENFRDDLDIAMTDIMGVSTSNSSRYISGPRIATIKKENLFNLFTKDKIVVGNAPDDKIQYYDFINMDLITPQIKSIPLYIHMDMSSSGDKTGIAGTGIIGMKPPEEGMPSSRELMFRLCFSVSIEAPKGYQISYEKNRRFIYWLKEQGFNVKGISTDTYQSVDTGQQLSARGYNYCVVSVDRVDADRICKPYQYLKNTIYEERLEMYEAPLLTDELIGLERDGNGKIDHSVAGINCFTGDTKISLVDGRQVPFTELVKEFREGKTNYVYSMNEQTKKIEAKPITNAWCSGHNAKLVEVTLDNGERIRCTPEHRFMLRNGVYCEAQNLLSGDSLMPLYTKVSDKGLKGYRLYYEPYEDTWHYEHRSFAQQMLDEKYLVHHKDCNKLNNSPNNLIWMSKQKHIEVHSKEQSGAYTESANAKRVSSVTNYHTEGKQTKEYWVRYHKGMTPDEALKFHQSRQEKILQAQNLKEQKHLHNQQKIEAVNKKRAEMCEYFGVTYDLLSDSDKHSLSVKYARATDPTYQERVSLAVTNNHQLGKYQKAEEALAKYNNNIARLKEMFPKVDNDKFESLFGFKYDELPKAKKGVWSNRYRQKMFELCNHKVVSVKSIEDIEDVYDITVEDNHNFALSAGVFVHNSKDQADALCGSIWNASQHAEEYAFDYGETLDTITQVSSHTDYSSDKQQVSVDFANELTKIFDPLKVQNPPEQQQKNVSSGQVLMDFGMGKAQALQQQYISNGIILPVI